MGTCTLWPRACPRPGVPRGTALRTERGVSSDTSLQPLHRGAAGVSGDGVPGVGRAEHAVNLRTVARRAWRAGHRRGQRLCPPPSVWPPAGPLDPQTPPRKPGLPPSPCPQHCGHGPGWPPSVWWPGRPRCVPRHPSFAPRGPPAASATGSPCAAPGAAGQRHVPAGQGQALGWTGRRRQGRGACPQRSAAVSSHLLPRGGRLGSAAQGHRVHHLLQLPA